VLARAGRARLLRAERIEELARHHVVAVLVDAAQHVRERRRAPRERGLEPFGRPALAEPPFEAAAELSPEALEQPESVGVVLERRARQRIRAAALRESAAETNLVELRPDDVDADPGLVA